ncbi:hypothetical protein LEP1GSC081_0554 [Leptospira kirschneri str. H1]|uniref:Uncharacterized protein n=1 Tax=Leptospira kirschneri str. H1 TaxID=1049966 RepID=A0A0E2B9G0_9LEPT|nr:hypothetical protein LEP1GSC081_0554 [Leptospira kirschneri str. H1]
MTFDSTKLSEHFLGYSIIIELLKNEFLSVSILWKRSLKQFF